MKKYLYNSVAVFIAIFVLVACNNPLSYYDKESDNNVSNDENIETIESDYPPMVMVNGHLYKNMGYVNSLVTCDVADGEITSSVDGSKLPEKDNESNFGKGYEYQFWDNSYVNVKIKNQWIVFQSLAISDREMPSFVANFKAKVIETSEDRLLVTMIDIEDHFKWVFQNKQIEAIKPISLTIENLQFDHNDEETDVKDLIGKIIQVWFDGSIKSGESEMSYPIELGEIYRITPVKE